MARKRSAEQGESLFRATREGQPLAARMRPRTLDEFAGQEHLLAPGKALREAIERGVPGSMIFWGPPGSGKTTLAHLAASTGGRVLVPFSAVSEGVPRIREIVAEARARLDAGAAGWSWGSSRRRSTRSPWRPTATRAGRSPSSRRPPRTWARAGRSPRR